MGYQNSGQSVIGSHLIYLIIYLIVSRLDPWISVSYFRRINPTNKRSLLSHLFPVTQIKICMNTLSYVVTCVFQIYIEEMSKYNRQADKVVKEVDNVKPSIKKTVVKRRKQLLR